MFAKWMLKAGALVPFLLAYGMLWMRGSDLLFRGWFGVFFPKERAAAKSHAYACLQKAKAEPVPKPWQRWEGDGGSRDAGRERAAPSAGTGPPM